MKEDDVKEAKIVKEPEIKLETIAEQPPSNRSEAVVDMDNGKRPQLKSRWAKNPKREYFRSLAHLLNII